MKYLIYGTLHSCQSTLHTFNNGNIKLEYMLSVNDGLGLAQRLTNQ